MLVNADPLTTKIESKIEYMPAGGTDPAYFDPKEAWYPVSYITDLERTKPTAFTLLDQDLVLWWDQNNKTWRAFADQCPHRLARLSEGRIAEDGLIECPYHGWAFKGNGSCDRIPQKVKGGTAEQSSRACVKSYATATAQGLLFVCLGEYASQVKVPIIDALEQSPEAWVCLNTFRDLPYDASTLLENVLDSSHLPFTHHESVGNRANAAPVELELTRSDKSGFTGVWAEGPRKGTLGTQDTVFIAPNLMWHDLTSKQFGVTMTVVYATPMRKGECRLFARFPFQFSSKIPEFFIKLTPQWFSHINQNAILEDDQIFLHHQERYLELQKTNFAQAYYLPTKADLFVIEYRKWLSQFNADPFAGQSLSPAQPKPVLLDRYHSHTIHCHSCRTALKNIQRLKIAVSGLGAIALLTSLLFNWQYIGAGMILIAIITWLILSNLEQKFNHGQEIPARNRL
ncbi:Rieske (2Fe-2S) domain-containing protein [Synechococcus sp. PCC 7502]|uniref:aromatic ring-hydroxylating dioxygenase subunit alpha n=1 Tax=Synechococcus sp. PCC 7502 TaxID=1173263 RepID=UPI00029FF553|nr:Rieske 2Fe-2S domain-containing protein [Synechococcus sp. PCC 7502]AFY75422.1 Rieske (2Fe-2S) domain-containing protein [Synechococcus sp. PCC 7502]